MKSSREMILKKIRSALKDIPDEDRNPEHDPVIRRAYHMKSGMDKEERVRLFTNTVREYRADVTHVTESELPKAIIEICTAEKVKKLAVPSGIDEKWLPEKESGILLLRDEPLHLTNNELDESDAVLTGCFCAVAQTGTIVLNGGSGQGRRKLTLLPDFHICVVLAEQIAGIVPEVFSELDTMMKESSPPVTFISGPSATSDIELDRVEGVHGPRRLHVLVVSM